MRLILKRQTFDIAAMAAALGLVSVAAAHAEAVSLPLHHAMRVSVNGAATAVLVGNPSVADVTVIDSRTLFITGRNYGGTNIIALDRYGQTVFSGDVVVVSPATAVKVYRGGARTDLACAPTCSPMPPVQGGASGGGEASSTPANVASGIAGANVAAGVVGNAMKQGGPQPTAAEGMMGAPPS
jgi:hypothetical protein